MKKKKACYIFSLSMLAIAGISYYFNALYSSAFYCGVTVGFLIGFLIIGAELEASK